MPVFFISDEQIRDGCVTVTGPLLTHLRDSLRIRAGDRITVADRHRRRYLIEIEQLDRARLVGRVTQEERAAPPHAPQLVAGVSLLKSDRMDWGIQKATELGVHRIVPLISARAVVRPRTERIDSRLERWRRIALDAAQQAERWDVPLVEAPREAPAFFTEQPGGARKLILQERGGGESLRTVALPSGPHSTIALAIGPEGGWTPEELARAADAMFAAVTLGERILRAETAAIAALALLQSRLGELG
jgi:16S rRNA (uracil1498-N3)-methyltransferase